MVGCYVNAMFWYPSHDLPWGALVGLVACTALVVSGVPSLRRRRRRTLRIGLLLIAAVVVVICAMAGVAVLQASTSVRAGSDAASDALDAARGGDAAGATDALGRAAESFDRAADDLDGPLGLPARFVPGVAQQLHAVRTAVHQGQAITAAGDDVVASADYDQLQYDGRLDLQQVEALVEPTERADLVLGTADAALDDVQQGRLLPPLRSRLETFTEEIEQARRDTRVAR